MKQLLCSLIEREPLKMEDEMGNNKDLSEFVLALAKSEDYLPEICVRMKKDIQSSDMMLVQLLCDNKFNHRRSSIESKKVCMTFQHSTAAPPFTVHVLTVGSSSGSKLDTSKSIQRVVSWFQGSAEKGSQSLLEFTSLQTPQENDLVSTHCKGKVEHESFDNKQKGTTTTMISRNRDFLNLIKSAGGIKKYVQTLVRVKI
eukprot:356974-Hanusia_phi.AAC.1